MKKSELRQLIREERNKLSESSVPDKWKTALGDAQNDENLRGLNCDDSWTAIVTFLITQHGLNDTKRMIKQAESLYTKWHNSGY